MENACLNDQQKSAIAERLAVAEHCLLEGADEYLQVNFSLNFQDFFPEPHECNSGDGSGYFHDEDASHGLKIEGEGESNASLVTLKKSLYLLTCSIHLIV